MDTKPLVSFIITYYNLPIHMLCECIDSILALSLRPCEREIIVVDDGSDISPMNGLMQYGDDIIYLRQKNLGVSVARNSALRMTRGKYIQIIDGDDYLLQTPYEHCLDLIRYSNDIDVVMFDFSKTTKAPETTFNDTTPMSGMEYLRNHNIRGAICCMLFRQVIRGELYFTKGIQYSEDEEFTPQLLLRAEVVVATDAKAYYYRVRNASAIHQTSKEKKEKRLNDTIEVITNLNRIADTLPSNDRLAMQRRVAQLTMDYIYNTIVLTRSYQTLNERLDELKAKGLYPLPANDYNCKYTWFRKLTNTRLGLSILQKVLPLLPKER